MTPAWGADKAASRNSAFTRSELQLHRLHPSCVYSRKQHVDKICSIRLAKCIWHFFSPLLSAFWCLKKCHLLTKLPPMKETPLDLSLAWPDLPSFLWLHWSWVWSLTSTLKLQGSGQGHGGKGSSLQWQLLCSWMPPEWLFGSLVCLFLVVIFPILSLSTTSSWIIEDGAAVF